MRKAIVTAISVLLLALVPATQAGATLIESGTTTFTLSGALDARLDRAGVDLSRLAPGKLHGRTLTLPLGGGQIEGAGVGAATLEGGFRLRAGGHVVAVEDIGLSTRQRQVHATIDGKPLLFGAVGGPKAVRDAFDIEVGSGAMHLSARAAKLLSRGLGLPGFFKGGQSLFKVDVAARLRSVKAVGGEIDLALDQGFATKLSSLGVKLEPFESATVNAANPPTFSMPIRNGGIGRDLTRGEIFSADGLRLIGSGERQLVLAPITISFDAKTAIAGINLQPEALLATEPLAQVDFAGSAVSAGAEPETLTVAGKAATLTPQAAKRLNEAFAGPIGKSPYFVAGEPLGALSFTAQTK